MFILKLLKILSELAKKAQRLGIKMQPYTYHHRPSGCMMTIRIGEILAGNDIGAELRVEGWVRTRRDTGSFSFLELNINEKK